MIKLQTCVLEKKNKTIFFLLYQVSKICVCFLVFIIFSPFTDRKMPRVADRGTEERRLVGKSFDWLGAAGPVV